LLSGHENEWAVCGEAKNGPETLSKVAELRPDIILLDLSLPLLSGMRVTEILTREYPGLRIVFISEQESSVLRLLTTAAGVSHFVPKSRLANELLPLIRTIAHDGP
jgi:DNA-binding NarL/FixJ family response regulator